MSNGDQKYDLSILEPKESPKEEYDLSILKKKDEPSEVSSETSSTIESPSESAKVEEGLPFFKNAAEKSKWLQPPINFLANAIGRLGPDVLDAFDGAQKIFYSSLGAALSATGRPELQKIGSKLYNEWGTPETRTLFKEWSEATTKYAEEKMPEPMMENVFDRLVSGAGSIVPMILTLPFTPEYKIANVSMRLVNNFAARSFLSEYSQSGDIAKALEGGLKGVEEGVAMTMLGHVGGKYGGEVTKALSGKIPAQAAAVTGAISGAAGMGLGGFSHSIAFQLANGVPLSRLDWKAAGHEGEMFVMFGVPHIMSAATSTYVGAPRRVVQEVRDTKAEVKDLREEAIKTEREAISETDVKVKAEKAVAASLLHKTADIKAIDQLMAKDPEGARKVVEKMDLSEADKKAFLEKIDEAEINAEYQKTLEKEAEKKPVEAPERAEEGVSPPSKGEVPSEAQKASIRKKGDKWELSLPGEAKMTKEFDTQQEAAQFLEDFQTITKGQITYGEKRAQTEAKKKEAVPKEIDIEKEITEAEKPQREIAMKVEGLSAVLKESTDPITEGIKQQISDFLDFSSKAIKEADITSGDVKALVNAKTLAQADKALQNIERRLAQHTKKERANALVGYIKENKGNFFGVSDRVHDAMLKKAVTASQSDAQFRNAVRYINKILNDAEFKEAENKRGAAIDKILKEASEKKVLERGGKRKRMKRSYLSREGRAEDINDLMAEIEELVSTGKSETYPNPLSRLDANLDRLELLSRKDQLAEGDLKEIDQIIAENYLLEFSALDALPVERVEQKLLDVRDLRKGQRAKIFEERKERAKKLVADSREVMDVVSGDKPLPEEALGKKQRFEKRTNKMMIWEEAQWNSTLAELARFDLKKAKEPLPLFRDRLNAKYTPMIRDATQKSERLIDEYRGESNEAISKILGVKQEKKSGVVPVELKKKLIDLSAKEESGVKVYNEDGTEAGGLSISQFEAAEKWLQLRDPDAIESLYLPFDKGGNGFTDATVAQLEAYLKPEVKKLADFFYENLKKYSDVLDEAYIKENGVSMKNANQDYWPMIKAKIAAKEQRGMEESSYRYPTISNDRTIRRTGDKSLIAYTSVYDTYRNYISDAIHYASWAEPVRELAYIFKNPEVRGNIKYFHGTSAMRKVDEYIMDFQGDLRRLTWEGLDKAMDNIVGGVLGVKIRPAVKQCLSTIYFGFEMPTHKLVSKTATAVSGTSKRMNKIKELLKKQPFLIARNSQSVASGQDIDASTLSMQKYGARPKLEKFKAYAMMPIDLAKEYGGKPLRLGDKMPIVNGGAAYLDYKYEQYAGKPLSIKTVEEYMIGKVDPNLRKALNDWDMVSMLTQQSQRQMNISMFRKKSTPGRLATVLTSGPMQIHRLAYNYGVREVSKSIRRGDYKGLRQNIQKAFVAHAVSGMLFQLAQQNFHPDSVKDWKRLGIAAIIGNLEAIALLGKGAGWLKALASDEWWAEEGIQPAMILDEIVDIGNSSWNMIEEMKSEVVDEQTLREEAAKAGAQISKLIGLPVEGAEKYVEGWKQVMTGVSREPLADVLGMGRFNEMKPLFEQRGYSYSNAVDEMGRKMKFSEDDVFVVDEEAVINYAEQLNSQGIDPASVIRTAYMDEVRKRFRRKYGKPSTTERVDELFAKSEEGMSDNDIRKLEKIYREIEKQEDDVGFMDEVMKELDSIIRKAEKESVGGYQPK